MANHLAIAAVAKTVLKLLEDHCPREEFSGTPGFTLYAGHDFTAMPVNEGFSVMVYRVTPNTTLRHPPARRQPDGLKRRPALSVDLGLMLTPWSSEPERQLRLMGWALRFIDEHAIIPAALLNQSLSRRSVPAFNADEAIEIVLDAPSLPDYLGLWDKFRSRWQTSLTYTVRMVNIESTVGIEDGPPVQARQFGYGQPVAGGV
jgi:hypothetical protein